ncbi:HipA domain-containing protein, partial [bacterium]|nr:HipA domain-containing protein [bacterium]
LTYVHTDEIQEQFLTLEELLQPKSINLFNELVSRFALNSPLSGVQPKVLARVQDKATLKLDDYIVKSWGDDYPQLALNEYYCMSIAKYAGIDVADFYISDDDKLFIMKRFDIQEDGTTLGFEDMCVLQAKQREDKYEGSYEQIAKSIKIFVSPEHKRASLQAFFKIIIINNLVQNGDAHLKNFGLIYKNITDIKLAPAYDIVSTTVYIKNDIPALTLLGSKKWWDKKYLLRFGVEFCELSKSDVLALYEECLHALEIVKNEIDVRIQRENNEVKAKLLENLLKTFSLEKN